MRFTFCALFLILIVILSACGDEPATPVADAPTSSPAATETSTPTLTATVTPTPFPTFTPSITPSITLTPSKTIVPSPTNTLGPTQTLTPSTTITATPTITPSPTASLTPVKLIVISEVGAYARSGPNTNYPVVGEVAADAIFNALAFTINSEGDIWYLIALDDGAGNLVEGWISQWVADRMDDVPLGLIAQAATVPASPTPLPTKTPTPTETPSPTPTLPPGANARVYEASRVNLRSGPGLGFARRGMMEPNDPLQLIGRSPNTSWYEINTFDGRTGWVLSDLVVLYNINAELLPVKWVDAVVPNGLTLTSNRLHRAYEIYEYGQQVGNRTDTFIVIGDSTSANTPEWFALFHAVPAGSFSVGSHTTLQPALNFYSASGSLGADFQTAQSGFATDYVLDPMWANPSLCNPGESPLDCEIRRRRPATAIIYIGIVDMVNYGNPALYQQNLERIIATLINQGVIPVLTTFSIDEAHHVNAQHLTAYYQINDSIRSLATQYSLPLIEFQQAAKALPNNGTIEDGRHLYYNLDGSMNLDQSNQLGQALRELMTLQMLDALRLYVFGG